jgi:hypothetical protein
MESGEPSFRRRRVVTLPAGRRVVTLATLVRQVACCEWSTRRGVTEAEAAAVWGALCDFIAGGLAGGTGVKLPGLGSFSEGPAFVMAPGMRTVCGGVPHVGAAIVPLNIFAVGARSGVRRAVAVQLIRLLLDALAGCVAGCAELSVDFGVGTVRERSGAARARSTSHLRCVSRLHELTARRVPTRSC